MKYSQKLFILLGLVFGIALLGGVYYINKRSAVSLRNPQNDNAQKIARNDSCIDTVTTDNDRNVFYVGCNGFF